MCFLLQIKFLINDNNSLIKHYYMRMKLLSNTEHQDMLKVGFV